MALKLLLFFALSILFVTRRSIAGPDTLESVPDLQRVMYQNIKSYPCVRLLNLSGEIGCSNPGLRKVVAPIVRLNHSDEDLSYPSAILLPLEKLESLFQRVSKDVDFAHKIAGVLVESDEYPSKSTGFSPAEKFPQAAFAPYKNHSYEWNADGSGIMLNHYNFPVFLLSPQANSIVQELADKNAEEPDLYKVHVAEFDLVMQTTKAHTQDSESCLKEQSCLPLGGFSVWSSLPPINVSSKEPPKPIIMVVASQDSASLFRDLSLGAESSISGLIALLTAVDALSYVNDLTELKKQLVFMVFTGEAWGYLGSRKFLQELDMGTAAVNGLDSTMIDQVLEIGSVGKGLDQGTSAATFYAHAGGNSSVTKDMLEALQSASDSLGTDNVKIKMADASNPGIPPSSLMAFLRKNTTAGIVLEDFGSSFSNKFYHSHLDNPSNINATSIAAAAALVARSLYILASGDMQVNLMSLNSIKVNVSLVEELVGCLLSCEPGLSCGIVKNFISPSNNCPNHYVGVFLDSPDTQYPEYADDVSRFVWNFLANKTSLVKDSTNSCTGKCDSVDEVCVGAETDGNGRCVVSTTRYVPAYSTRLELKDNAWHVIHVNSSDPMGSVDPIWTESFWNTIGLRVYTVQSSTYDWLILTAGVGITVASYIATIMTKAFLAKTVKND
ncbi:nicastrin-like [Zingiber officinale]|uniref:nicastrin-like n=1 Tax=Zingiber officinale TaxID=94328 RepID=UPI001C4C6DFD|nr:nicastrin-like [Zingiber officinale]